MFNIEYKQIHLKNNPKPPKLFKQIQILEVSHIFFKGFF